MNTTGKVIGWVCIISILLTGCYSNTILKVDELPEADSDKAFQGLNGVVTKDSVTYALDTAYVRGRNSPGTGAAASTAVDSLIGLSQGKRVALPLSSIRQVSVAKFDPVVTTFTVMVSTAIIIGIVAAFKNGPITPPDESLERLFTKWL